MPNLTQDYARLIHQAIVELPGATDAGIAQKMFEVMHEFFTETNSWQETISISIAASSKGPYLLTIAEGGEFVCLLSLVNANGTPIPAVTDMVGTVTLRDTPNVASTGTAIISKTIGVPVARDGTPQVPDWTFARFEPVVMSGLLGMMMMQVKKPYSNQVMGQYHLRRFRNGLGRVKSAIIHGNLYGANTWRFPTAWVSSGQRSGRGGTDTSFA